MAQRMELRFKPGQPFKIVQFTDLHFGGSPDDDAKTQQAMGTVLASEPDADLVVLSGDCISGWLWDRRTKGWAEAAWRAMLEPLEAAGVPYAVALGNHDIEADLSARSLVSMDQRSSSLSLTLHGPPELPGSGNYWLCIKPSTGGDAEAARIWFFDSPRCPWWYTLLAGCAANAAQRIWLVREGWYAQQRGVPQLAFTHVPLPEFMALWDYGGTAGTKGEPVCCAGYHPGVFAALRAAGVTAAYAGHDHDNDYCGTHQGVRLAYGLRTGHGGYGRLPRGARVILLREGEDPACSETYLRLGDGTRRQQAASPTKPWWRAQWYGR